MGIAGPQACFFEGKKKKREGAKKAIRIDSPFPFGIHYQQKDWTRKTYHPEAEA
jgi:hypothetical protein